MQLISDFNYEAAKELVDFYQLNTFQMNSRCNPESFNVITPIRGSQYMFGLVILFIYCKFNR